MKKPAIILAVCAVIACAVVMLPRSKDPQQGSGQTPDGRSAAGDNTRNRPERESDSDPDALGEGMSGSGQASTPSAENPQAALAEATARLQDPERSIAIAELLGTWAETDPIAALAWVEESGPGRENPEDLRAHILLTWSNKKPEAAATWLEENAVMRTPANLLALLGPWMGSSPEAAVAWSTTKIEINQREEILADLLTSCGSEENALALLGEVDPVVADNALQAAVTSIADEEPELAKKLAALVTGPVDATEEKPRGDSASPDSLAPSGQ